MKNHRSAGTGRAVGSISQKRHRVFRMQTEKKLEAHLRQVTELISLFLVHGCGENLRQLDPGVIQFPGIVDPENIGT